MPETSGYLRHPSLRGDTIAFVTEDDLWSVPAAGGIARRLTANLSEVSHPALSPDGRFVAFTSREEHHPEVYCMPATGGPAERLTFLGGNSTVRGWTPDGRVLFTSEAGQPFHHMIHAYAVAPEGGPVERLPYGPARELAFGPNGRPGGPPRQGRREPPETVKTPVVLGRNTADPARWKRYRGGTAGDLWIDPKGNGKFHRLLRLPGNPASPMWIDGRIWFLSDHEGIGNLYSTKPDGTDLRRHTDHDEYYARFAKTDNSRIVYQHAAEIWLHDPATDEGHRVEIDLHSPRVQRHRKFVAADRYLGDFSLHPAGHSIALETRGKLFTMPLWEEAVRQYGRPDGVRYRLAKWVGDGSSIVVVSDEGGEDGIEIHKAGDTIGWRLEPLDLGCITDLATPPSGTHIAVANHRHELHLVDLDQGTSRLLDRSDHGALNGIVWSPDGKWVAYSFATTARTRSIKVCEVASGATHLVTTPEFRDVHPSWDPEGKYLYFLSYRVFDPVYDSLYFDLGFPRAIRPYLVTLTADERSPFVPKPKGMGGATPKPPEAPSAPEQTSAQKPAQKKEKGDKKKPEPELPAGPAPMRIDLEGITERIVPVPVPEGRYSQVVGMKGKILLTSWPVQGSLGRDAFSGGSGPRGTLEVYDLGEQRHDVLTTGINSFELSRDTQTLAYRSGRRLRVIKAGEKPPDNDDGTSRRSGWLDLDRVRVSVDPGSEWMQMFKEAWRLQRDHFWAEDMSGVDWWLVLDRYTPLVGKVATRLEFSDLMWEMQGELGTSHAYELGGDYRPAPAYLVAHLAADLAYDEDTATWRFTHIVDGDPWDPESGSPLRAPGVRISVGDRLLAVNGRPVNATTTPASLLVNQAGLAVELTVAGSDGGGKRTVVVSTLRDDRAARYREWVSANRAKVHEMTKGRVGYVHVPDMGARGYAEFHRSYLAEVEREALIVDVRFNGGGHVSQLVLEKLARRRIGYDISRWGAPEPYPADSPAGPLVALTNEHAGSDGDIFTHCFKLLGLGPVVGKRTWGGVIGIDPRHALVDGSLTTQPEYAFWFSDVGWSVENYGTDPDYEVDIRPQDHVEGADPQLDKAVALALAALREHRPLIADLARRPRLELPTLPPRDQLTGNGTAAAPAAAERLVTAQPVRKRAPAAKAAATVRPKPAPAAKAGKAAAAAKAAPPAPKEAFNPASKGSLKTGRTAGKPAPRRRDR
ncbi:MAG TPA: S41 family peptidase [Acidimicrobiia bacterium]|nr:S41 family peptidase [Acidimicrobiia bacterium]